MPPSMRRWRHLKRGTTYIELFRGVVMGVVNAPEGTKLSIIAITPTKLIACRTEHRGGRATVADHVTLQTEKPAFGANLLVYMSDKDGEIHAREQMQFLDGRFEEIPIPPVTRPATAQVH